MRLWQKIFLCTLILTILAINTVSYLLLFYHHQIAIKQQKEIAATSHSNMLASIQNEVNYQKMENSILLLSEGDAFLIMQRAIREQESSASFYQIYNNERQPYINLQKEITWNTDDLLAEAEDSNRYQIEISNQNGNTYLMVASRFMIDRTVYYLTSEFDITPVYQNYNQQIQFAQLLGIGLSVLIAVILVILVLLLLRPLQKVNQGTKEIAQGNYGKRLRFKGNNEISELADNLNQMAASIETKVDALEQVANNRQQFIANLAHEMKTPLTSILGFADLLRVEKDVDDTKRISYADTIVKETKRLSSLSSKLTELILVQNGRSEMRTVDLMDLMREIEVSVWPILKNNELSMKTRMESVQYPADPELFKSMIYNLIDNAIKASPPGSSIQMSLSKQRDGSVEIQIKDHGIGIPEEDQQKIMEPFYMVDKSRSRKAGGAGLGLSLCVEIAKLHHGSIELSSQLGQGSTFTIHLRGGDFQ